VLGVPPLRALVNSRITILVSPNCGRVAFLSKEKQPKETSALGLLPATRAVFLNQKSCRAKLALFRFLHIKLNRAQTWRVMVIAAIFASKTLTPSMAEQK